MSPRALRRIIRRILLLQRCNQGIEVPLRGLRRETRLKARDGLVGGTRAAHRRRGGVGVKSGRRPQFGTDLLAGLALVAKAGGHDADNKSGIVVNAQSLADNVRVGAKCALPEPIADDDFVVEAGCGVVRIEGAPQLRVDAEHREVARCDRLSGEARGLAAAGKSVGAEKAKGHILEDSRVLKVSQLGDGEADVVRAHAGKVGFNSHQLAGVGVGQRMQQGCVDDAVDGGGGSDAERDCGDRNERKSGRPPKHANRVPQVEEQILDQGKTLLGVVVFPDRLRPRRA